MTDQPFNTDHNQEQEIWKPIPDFDGYEASNFGKIRSWKTQCGCCKTKRIVPHVMALATSRKGYLHALLLNSKHKTYKKVYAHSAVLWAFVGDCPDGLQRCHNSGIKSDNRLSNLRYDTPENNIKDKVLHGHTPSGEKHPDARLTAKDILEIRKLYADGKTQAEIATLFSICAPHASRIVRGEKWSHLKLELPLPERTYFRGEECSNSKLTGSDVIEIRRLRSDGATYRSLAKKFTVHPSTIQSVLFMKSWRHI